MAKKKTTPETEKKDSDNVEEKSEETKDEKEESSEPSKKESTEAPDQKKEEEKDEKEIDWKKRHSDSSREAHKLLDKNKVLEAKLAEQEKEREAGVFEKVLSRGLGGDQPEETQPGMPNVMRRELQGKWKDEFDTFRKENPDFKPDGNFIDDFDNFMNDKKSNRTFRQSLDAALRIHPSYIKSVQEKSRVEGIAEVEDASEASSESLPSSVSSSPPQEKLTAEETIVAGKMGVKPEEAAEYKNYNPNIKE